MIEPPLDVSQNTTYLNILVPKNVHILWLPKQPVRDTLNPLSSSIKNASHKSTFHLTAAYTFYDTKIALPYMTSSSYILRPQPH